jgi:hypothetical protein
MLKDKAMMHYMLTILLLAMTANCSHFTQSSTLPQDKYQISEINFERSGSFGVPSGYKVVLRKDGTAIYDGESSAKRKGKYYGKVDSKQFEEIAKLIAEQNFFSLEDRINSGWTDAYSITISVLHKGGRKKVENHNGGDRLMEIGKAIDSVAVQITWQKDES